MGTTFIYRCYDVTIGTNRSIPGLLPATSVSSADISIDLSGRWPAGIGLGRKHSWDLRFPTEANLPPPAYEAWFVSTLR